MTHDETVNTALEMAFQNDDKEQLSTLWDANPNVRADKNIYLRNSAQHGANDCVTFLIEKGANPNHEDNSPIVRAAANNHPSTVKLLLDHGADINCRNSALIKIAVKDNRIALTDVLLHEPNLETSPLVVKSLEQYGRNTAAKMVGSKLLHEMVRASVRPESPKQELGDKKQVSLNIAAIRSKGLGR